MKKEDVVMQGFIPNPQIYNGVESLEAFIARIQSFMNYIKKIEDIKK